MTHTAALPVAQPAPPGLWVIHCDGSAIPNPGRMGLGATLLAPDGQQHTLSHTSSLVGCDNEAELRALMAALQQSPRPGRTRDCRAQRQQPPHRTIAAAATRPAPRCPIARLAELFDSARAWLARFDSVQWQWIPRHRNSAADTLARAALGAPAKVGPHPQPQEKEALNLSSKAPPAPWAGVAMSLLRHSNVTKLTFLQQFSCILCWFGPFLHASRPRAR